MLRLTDDGLLAHAVCNVPALSQELASNLDALLANKQLATLVGRNPDMQVGDHNCRWQPRMAAKGPKGLTLSLWCTEASPSTQSSALGP